MIALVDDDSSVRSAVASLLRSFGMAVDTFGGAEEFLQSARCRDTACLIADVQMPGMGGLELQERLIALGFRLPIIFITAHPEPRLRARALASGAVAFMDKPFSADELIRCIESALLGSGQPQP